MSGLSHDELEFVIAGRNEGIRLYGNGLGEDSPGHAQANVTGIVDAFGALDHAGDLRKVDRLTKGPALLTDTTRQRMKEAVQVATHAGFDYGSLIRLQGHDFGLDAYQRVARPLHTQLLRCCGRHSLGDVLADAAPSPDA